MTTVRVGLDLAKAEPGLNADAREVRHPHEIRAARDHIAIKVREDRRVVVTVGGANKPLTRLDPQAMHLHEARDALVVAD